LHQDFSFPQCSEQTAVAAVAAPTVAAPAAARLAATPAENPAVPAPPNLPQWQPEQTYNRAHNTPATTNPPAATATRLTDRQFRQILQQFDSIDIVRTLREKTFMLATPPAFVPGLRLHLPNGHRRKIHPSVEIVGPVATDASPQRSRDPAPP